jgi:tRNA/tmRNA/rRNA uracil-C5-methylase (TrmA/RlmC/RlmD family)
MTDLLELVIEKTVYNGYSLCRHNGIVIFTRWGVPGDKVNVKILEKKRNYYLGEIISRNLLIIRLPYAPIFLYAAVAIYKI